MNASSPSSHILQSAQILPHSSQIPPHLSQIQPSSPISIAGFMDIYAVADVQLALDDLPTTANEALRATYEKMLRAGGTRLTVKPSGLPAMDALYAELPNFSEALDDIRRQLALCTSSQDAFELTPMLLVGGPGIGKTHFGKRVASLLATGFGFMSMSTMTAGWVLSGASSQWKNAKPGKLFDTFLTGQYANPVMMVDEIDKAGGESHYDPLGALYTLLEHDTAQRFVDEFVEIPINASAVAWIATANDIARIPEPILNRMNVYQIDPPDNDGSMRIAQSIYAEIRGTHDWGKRFAPDLNDDTLALLTHYSPREMRRLLVAAFGNATLAVRDQLSPSDIDDSKNARRARIGF